MAAPSGVATIESTPAAGQTVEHEGISYTTIKEGLAHILVPPEAKTITNPKADKQDGDEKAQNVFYNPIQQFNRDLSVLAIRAFSEDFAQRRTQRAEKKSGNFQKKRERKAKARKECEAKKADEQANGAETTHNGATEVSMEDTTTSGDVTKETAKDPAPLPQTDDAGNETTDTTAPTVPLADEPDSKKRKEAPEGDCTSNSAKKVKLDASHETNEPADHSLSENGVSKGLEIAQKPALDPGVIDPEAASKAPNGQRPDDKLRSSMRILDALSATGLRALRYASELPLPVIVTANDLLATATAAIKLNVRHNELTSKINATTSNAQAHMYNAAFGFSAHAYAKYDVIDLDPYGTAVPFIESALHAINDNGLLCVTCTDAGVFNSMGYLEKTYALYGGLPLKGLHAHEAGLRLILNSIATTAAKHGLAIEPLLSLSIDFYARVFVRVHRSPAEVKFLASKTMTVHSCDSGCGAWTLQPLARTSTQADARGKDFYKYHPAQSQGTSQCEHCGFRTHLAGPMWGGPLHNPSFIGKILSYLPVVSDETYATKDRIEGMLTTALDELEVLPATFHPSSSSTTPSPSSSDPIIPPVPAQAADPHPFAFSVSALSRVLHCQAPPESAIRGALRKLGYVATRSHTKPGVIKTQAPWDAIWDTMREWVRTRAPVKQGAVRKGTPGYAILYGSKAEGEEGQEWPDIKPSTRSAIEFDEVLGRDRRPNKLVRYQMNPRDNWGPMSKARG